MNYQKIKLLGGAVVHVDLDSRYTACSKCGELIKFGITDRGRYMPIIRVGDNWESHFAECKFASSFRKSREDQINQEEVNQELLNSL